MKLPFTFRKKVTTSTSSARPRVARPSRRWWPWVRRGLYVLGGFIVLGLVVTAYYYPKLKPALSAANQAQSTVKKIAADVSAQKFDRAQKQVNELKSQLDSIDHSLQRTKGLRWWPYVGRQYNAVGHLMAVAHQGTAATGAMVDFAAQLFAPFAGQGKVSLASISPEEKGKFLTGMASHETSLKEAQTAIHHADDALQQIPAKGLIGPLQRVVTPLKQQFPLIRQAIDQAIPATHVLPPVLGSPNERTYLFLLQNNNELRPGGGFIGTYGLLKLHNGEILSLKTDNTYNLDEAAKNLPIIPPPEPMQKYLKAKAWYFRDSNWSPDFPTSAKQAIQFYEREGGKKNVDGVIAITPSVISQLLHLVGPITVYKIEFNSENFTDRLQDYVGQGFKSYGLTESQRKDIIGVMTTELVNRLLGLPLSEWKDLFLILSQEINHKQFLMYMQDTAVQGILVDQNWGGSIQGNDQQDYVMVVDANLASLKTDSVMRRTYTYEVSAKDGTATLKVHYQHTGKFDWRTSTKISRYNTFVRVYVPSGSTLINSNGAQLRERSNAAGKVTTSTELGRTVFGAYKSIEPGTESDLVLTYKLPEAVLKQLEQDHYDLNWQKEAGLTNASINLTITTNKQKPKTATGLDNLAQFRQDAITFTGPLDSDRFIHVSY